MKTIIECIVRICVITSILLLLNCNPPNLFAHDTPANFRGSIGVSTPADLSFGSGLCEDLPHPDYINRFRILIYLTYPNTILVRARHLTNVRVQATVHGLIEIDIPNWGLIEILPAEYAVRQHMRNHAPAYEIRAQYVTVTVIEDGVLEVYIDEPRLLERSIYVSK